MLNQEILSPSFVKRVREVWETNDLYLDLPIMDIQHIWLVAILVDLQDLIHDKKAGPENFHNSLKEAAKYAYVHFSIEEDLMKSLNFPVEASHKKMHRAFVKTINQQIPINRPTTEKDVEKLSSHLQDWLFNHIVREDVKYRDFILQNKISTPDFSIGPDKITDKRILPLHKELYKKVMAFDTDEITRDEIVAEIYEIWERYKLAVYIPIVDIQHMWLVKLVIELDRAARLSEFERKRQFNKTVVNAVDYIKEHFATEEILMSRYNYPGLSSQQAQHRYFVNFLTRRNEESKEGDPMAVANLVNDLREWLLTHIAVEDKKLRAFFNERMNDVLATSKEIIQSGEISLRKGQVNLYRQVLSLQKEKS